MANALNPTQICNAEEDWRLPGLELHHDLHVSLRSWSSLGSIIQALHEVGAEVHALSLSRQADAFVLRCRVKSISAAQARAFADDLSQRGEGAASVEHLMLAKAADHAGA